MAGNGPEAIKQAEQLQPDLILMDAQMPHMDGIQATRLIKGRLPNIKVLFLTAHSSYIQGALDAGADGYLMKDCSRYELIKKIRDLASKCEPK